MQECPAHSRQLVKVSFLPNIWFVNLLFSEDVRLTQTQELLYRRKMTNNTIPLTLPEDLMYSNTVAQHCPASFEVNSDEKHYSFVAVPGNPFEMLFLRVFLFLFLFGFGFNNNSCALNQLLFVPCKVTGIWGFWKMPLHSIDQRFFSLRTGSLPSRTLIKPSPFSQAPKEFSFPPSSLKSDSTLGRLMKWLCHEEDAEGLSSQTPQIPSSSVRLIYSTIRLRPVCPLWPSLVWGWNQHLRIGSSQSCMFVKRWPTRDSLLWDMTLEHTSGIPFQRTALCFLYGQPLCPLSSVSHFIFGNKFLLVICNSLRFEALIRSHLGHIKLFCAWAALGSHYFTPHSKCLIMHPPCGFHILFSLPAFELFLA